MPKKRLQLHTTILLVILGITPFPCLWAGQKAASLTERPWKRHVIDDSSRGADGVRLADVNGDGLLDIATGWEEGGKTRVYVHPGYSQVQKKWSAVTVGKSPSVEDAVFCDVDNDGAVDVISSCEGRTKCMFIHWAPTHAARYLQANAWKTEAIPITEDRSAWMFALPLQLDGKYGSDIAVASKGMDALVGWLQAPKRARVLSAWKLHALYQAGWIMSLRAVDIDGDGDRDLIVSDRKGKNAGVLWLENPGAGKIESDWPSHRIGAFGREVMFLDVSDLDGDGRQDIVVAVKPDEIHWFRSPANPTQAWFTQVIKVTYAKGLGTAKAVRVGDMDGDGRPDIVYSCEGATPPKRGLVWIRHKGMPNDKTWITHELSGPEGIKYDRIELLDLDGDGDLDVLTCEERHKGIGIGVFWYENPFGVGKAPD